MKELRKSSQFKKDFKRFSKDVKKVEKLFAIYIEDVLTRLMSGEQGFIPLFPCKNKANECNESLLSDCRMQFVLSNYKTSKKVDAKAA